MKVFFGQKTKVVIECMEDLWHLSKVLGKGDFVEGYTLRKVERESGAERKKIWVRLKVEKVEFHPYYGLRLLGKIVEGRPLEFISLGSYHSLDISPGTTIWIDKAWRPWEKQRLLEATRERPVKIWVLIMDENVGELFAIRTWGYERAGEVRCRGRKKREGAREEYWRALEKLIENKEPLIIGGPGFEGEAFAKHLKERGREVMYVKSNHVGITGLREVVKKGVEKLVKNLRFVKEEGLVEEFKEKLAHGLAEYGGPLERALDYGAVEKVLVCEELVNEVKDFLEKVEKFGGKVEIISKENESAYHTIKSFGGIVGILRFKV